MNRRAYFSVLFAGMKFIKKNMSVISGGQAGRFALIQQAHKLEKGLSIRDPKKLWGYENAKKLVDYIADEAAKTDPDLLALNIGKAVIQAYLAQKGGLEDESEREKTDQLKTYVSVKLGDFAADSAYGGTLALKREDVLVDEQAVCSLFTTRHSVRDFADTPVERDKLEKAVNLALRAPSACNRQPTQIYVMDGSDRVKIGSDNTYHADKYLILTGEMNAFSISELNDWIVSTSIFAAYLTLALHAEGIGACVFRKDMIRESKYNDSVRKMCRIPDNEQIVLEIAIGNFRDEFRVPVSYRREAVDIIHYLE